MTRRKCCYNFARKDERESHTLEYCLQSGNVIFYLYDSTNAITRQEGEKSSNRKNNKRSLSEFETVSVSARKGLFFCKNFCSLLDNRIWTTREKPDFMRVYAA